MNTGKCPKCDAVIDKVIVEDISLNDEQQPRWRGFSYCCSACKTVLGVQMNPLALNFDLISQLRRPEAATPIK